MLYLRTAMNNGCAVENKAGGGGEGGGGRGGRYMLSPPLLCAAFTWLQPKKLKPRTR